MELLRLRIGQRPQEDGVDHTEYRGGPPDAERQGDDNGRRKAGVAPQRADGEANISCRIGQDAAASLLGDGLAGEVEPSHAQPGAPARLFFRNAGGELPVELVIEVLLEFGVQIDVEARRPEQLAHALTDAGKPGHASGLRAHDATDGQARALPGRAFRLELLPAGRRQPVVPRAASGVGGAPLRGDPSAPEQALQGGVEGARLHVEDVARQLRDALADAPAMHGPQIERLQDQHVERALQEYLGVVWHSV
jgi:hypothetical protein